MNNEITAALVSMGGSLIGAVSGMKMISYRLEQVEKKLDALKDIPERLTVAENNIIMAGQRLERLERPAADVSKSKGEIKYEKKNNRAYQR